MIRVGTRGSALALAQATWVAERLGAEYELVTISRSGPVDDKSRWVSELERTLLAGEIDVAVHSAKDVPAELPDGLELVAFPESTAQVSAVLRTCQALGVPVTPCAARTAAVTMSSNKSMRHGSADPPPRRVTLGTGQPKLRST